MAADIRSPARFADADQQRAAADTFDIRRLPPSFYDNPYPTYHALREHTPIRWLAPNSVLLTRYADIVAVYKDAKIFSSDKQAEFKPKFGDGLLYEHHTTSLIFNDPPLHTRVRKIMAGALNPRAVADLEAPMTEMVDGLLDKMAAKFANGGEADIIADLAAAVPIEVIGNLLGIPHDKREPLRDWSIAILGALEPQPDAAMLAAGETAVDEFLAYLRILIADRRLKPGNPERDVLTRLIQGEQVGEKLSEVELLHNCIFILNAGHETTTNLIGNGLYALLEWPQERARLIANPALIPSAVEEFLRFDSPVQLGNRLAVADTSVAGENIPAGTFITIGIGAANRDAGMFPDPDRLDVSRTQNRHLAFASGVHVCVGLAIARMEGRVTVQRFLQRFPNYCLARAPVRGGRARFRGFLELPVVLA